MSIKVDHDRGEMRSTLTGHFAKRQQDGWHVSYLPDRTFTHEQAMTAMVLAEWLAADSEHRPPRLDRHIGNWMAELGITAEQLPQPLASHEGGEPS